MNKNTPVLSIVSDVPECVPEYTRSLANVAIFPEFETLGKEKIACFLLEPIEEHLTDMSRDRNFRSQYGDYCSEFHAFCSGLMNQGFRRISVRLIACKTLSSGTKIYQGVYYGDGHSAMHSFRVSPACLDGEGEDAIRDVDDHLFNPVSVPGVIRDNTMYYERALT